MTDQLVVNHFAWSLFQEALITRMAPARVAAAAAELPLREGSPLHVALGRLMAAPLTPAERRAMRYRFGF